MDLRGFSVLAAVALVLLVVLLPESALGRLLAFSSIIIVVVFLYRRAIWRSFSKERMLYGYILMLFLSTRIVLALIGWLSRVLLEPFHSKLRYSYWVFPGNLWLDVWGAWDTRWYMDIAQHWYSTFINHEGFANYAFFPLYPALMRGLGMVIGDYHIAGLLVSNIFLVVACIFLYKLVKLDYGDNIALNSIKYLFLFPTAFILSGVLTESLSLALAILCFYHARKGNWLAAGVLGLLLSLTKSIGVFIILPLLYEYLKTEDFKLNKVRVDVLSLLLIPVGLIIFAVYNYYLTGDYLAFLHIQMSGWGHRLGSPVSTLIDGVSSKNIYAVFPTYFAIVSLALLIFFYGKIRFSYWLLGMYSIVLPLSTVPASTIGLGGMSRYVLVIFPFYILFARLSENRHLNQVITISLALLQGFLMVFWSNGFNLVM